MDATSVTSKGQVTIPKAVRQKLGIRRGQRLEFTVVGDHAELRVSGSRIAVSDSGFGLLKSRRGAMPAALDPASLVER